MLVRAGKLDALILGDMITPGEELFSLREGLAPVSSTLGSFLSFYYYFVSSNLRRFLKFGTLFKNT